jgi:hypothetical protein
MAVASGQENGGIIIGRIVEFNQITELFPGILDMPIHSLSLLLQVRLQVLVLLRLFCDRV